MPSPAIPCLAFCGEADGDVDKEVIRTRMAHWPNGNYVLIPEGHHDLLSEQPEIREAVTDQILDLMGNSNAQWL